MIRRVLILLVGLGFGAGASQGPEFTQQYLQRLGGWVDSYKDRVARLDSRAKQFDMTRDEYIQALKSSADPKVRQEASNIATWPLYLDKYSEMQQILQNGPAWMRPIRLVQNYTDPAFAPIVQATLDEYEPGTQLSGEGIAFGAGGFVLGWIATGIALSLAGMPFRMARRVRNRPRKLPDLVAHRLDEQPTTKEAQV